MAVSGYSHGWQPCRACHSAGAEVRIEGSWHMRANPGYWGSSNPEVLVLGFSKGATQMAAASQANFDAVAFAGMRTRLTQVLDALGVGLQGQSIDEALTAKSKTLGAASLVRCGLSLDVGGRLVTSGTIMPKALSSPATRGFMATCIQRHLDPLPESVRLVVLLGTTDAYMKGVRSLFADRFPDYRTVNEVAFSAQSRLWVFAAHPSPANGEFQNWLTGSPSEGSGRKRHLALVALDRVTPTDAAESTPTRLPTPPQTTPAPPRSDPKPVPLSTRSAMPSVRAETFYLLTDTGAKQIPVRMKNQDTGRVAFRLSKIGNTKSDSIEVDEEAEALRLCQTGQYLIRVITEGKAGSNALVRPGLGRRIVVR